MSSMYTKDNPELSGKIFFLNDNNIAFAKNDMGCAAGFNAVASQKEFVEVYGEFGKVSSDIYGLSGKAEMSAAALDGKIGAVSAVADAKFLTKAGGVIDGGLSVRGGLSVGGRLDTEYIKTDDDGKITVTGKKDLGLHGGIDMQFEHGLNDISVNGASLSSYIRESINELDVAVISADQGQILSEVSQHNGIISANKRSLISADIPDLPTSKIAGLKDYAEKAADSRISAFSLSNDNGRHALWLINRDVGLNISVDTDEFIKDGMISSVSYNISGDAQHSNPPYVLITWNTDSGKTGENQQTWLPIKEFANVYSTEDLGIDAGKLKKFELALDYGYVARLSDVQGLRSDVGALQTYATELSVPVVGTIAALSAGVDRALSSNVRTVKFIGHIELDDEVSSMPFAELLDKYGNLDEDDRILNGAMIEVRVASDQNRQYVTSDGLALGFGDYVYVHKHGMDPYVQKGDILASSRLANPVHGYDVADLRKFVVDNFVKLSGGNEISGVNDFYGINNFHAPLFALDGLTVYKLSVAKGAAVDNLSAYGANVFVGSISVDGGVSASLSSFYDTDSGLMLQAQLSGLSGKIENLAQTKRDLSNLVYAVSGDAVIDTLALSGDVSSRVADLSAEISARAMLSVDGEPVQDFRFWHISQDDYHDLVLGAGGGEYGLSCDPHTLYVVSSDVGTCMYGQRITDMAPAEDEYDAVTYGQLLSAQSQTGSVSADLLELKTDISEAIASALSGATLEDNLPVQLSTVVKCLFDIKNRLA